jgi:hypothetical protein
MFPLPLEEYFQDICYQCQAIVDDVPHPIFLSEEEPVILCQECSFDVHQCIQCTRLVSRHGNPFREMVYAGAENVWDELFIFCRECFEFLQQEEDADTDTEEEEVFVCTVSSETQLIF